MKGAIMTTRAAISLIVISAVACGVAWRATAQNQPAAAAANAATAATFAQQVDLRAFAQVAVHTQGRVKSLESFARSSMQMVSGSHDINNQQPTFTYFDLMLRPGVYAEQDIVYFKNKLMRADVVRALRTAGTPGFDAEREAAFMKTGLLSSSLIMQPAVIDLLGRLAADVLRSARFVDNIQNALGVMNSDALRANLHFIPPATPEGAMEQPWMTIDDVIAGDPRGNLINASLRDPIVGQWQAFQAAWRN